MKDQALSLDELTFFDASAFEGFRLGESSESDVRELLGKPYLIFDSGDRTAWIYDYSIHMQAIFYFRDSIMREKSWTIEYQNPVAPELILKARPELKVLPRK